VWRGEVLGIVGGSGTGKSVLMRTIVGLNRPRAGSISVLGVAGVGADEGARHAVERRWGVLFQDGALFSSLTVAQNIEVPMK
ncbi:ATP-binding cassette domain-containing protein, partial [Staphylococcus aureus]